MTSLLNGLRIVEAAEVWAGPMGGTLLADMGADVIKVESFPRISMTRLQGRLLGGQDGTGPSYERSGTHQIANRNKRNIAVDLRSDAGSDVMRRLIAGADVFFEGYSAGTMQRLGFGWERACAINPRLVMISMPGWGLVGPYEGYVTLGSGLDAATGHMSVRGYPDRDMSATSPIFHSDATGALTLNVAILAGLRRRDATGEGCFIDMAQTEAMAWQLPGLFAEWTMNGRLPERLGNVDPHIVPHGCYRAAGDDEWVVVVAESDEQWAGLAALIGHPDWAADGHAFAGVVGRLRARSEIDDAIAAFAATLDAAEVAEQIQAAGAISAPVVSPPAMLASPQLNARQWFQTVEHRYLGERILGGFLWNVPEDPPTWDRPCGLVGEHNHEVLAELGYSDGEIAALQRDGVIGEKYELTPA